jgi:hypothetical protein
LSVKSETTADVKVTPVEAAVNTVVESTSTAKLQVE